MTVTNPWAGFDDDDLRAIFAVLDQFGWTQGDPLHRRVRRLAREAYDEGGRRQLIADGPIGEERAS